MLTEVKFAPGIDKQDTSVGAAGRWVDSDLARFRYGLPEKIGGWSSLLTDTIVGVARKQHSFVDKDGNRYVSIGTDKFLLIYFEGQLFDITPVKSTIASVVMSASDASKEVTLTFSSAHNLESGDIILLDSVTVPSGIGLTDAAFEDKLFQVTRVTSDLVAIITGTETTTGAAGGGSCSVIPYERVGPAAQSYGYGYGVSPYGGTVQGSATTTLNGGIVSGTTTITLTDSSSFPTSGTVLIGNFSSGSYASTSELVTYTGNTANQLTGCSRSQLGTTAPGSTSTGTTVTNATDWSGWGDAVDAGTIILEPGLWSLSNFSDTLVATIANGKTFTWNSAIAARLSTRASTTTSGFQTTNNPTATRITLISPTTRHLIHLGTETTIGDTSTQDDMFIRFSSAENINEYTPLATNSAGTQRIQDGTKIVGALVAKENILIWTNNALYTMKFVGAPFTFGFEQVGTNCGLIGKNAAVEIDGVAYWMSNNGFFAFDGTVNSLPCSVEDYVFDDVDTTKGQQVCAGLNNLFTEVVWWYPTAGSDFNNRSVSYNYGEAKQPPLGTWVTNTNTNFNRTTWMDTLIYPQPYATSYNSTGTGTFPAVIGESGLGNTTYFAQETGTDQINPDGSTTALESFIQSFSFSLQQGQSEVFLAMRRFLPNFKVLAGNNKVTISVKDFPADNDVATALSPFTIDSTTTKIDTRARGRYANIKIQNTAAGESWRFGTFQVDLQPDGRRG
jgi:hypothetical protein